MPSCALVDQGRPAPGRPHRGPTHREPDFDSEFDEEADEVFSDDDDGDLDQENNQSINNDVTEQLLRFAEMVNSDIQRFFGHNKDEDACDIYEDKWTSGKSGRELYYADLMKIAQGIDTDDPKSPGKGETHGNADNLSIKGHKSQAHTGKMDKKIGLGPLEELFEIGLKTAPDLKKTQNTKKVKRLQNNDTSKKAERMPMSERKLPQSFWREPSSVNPESVSRPDCAISKSRRPTGPPGHNPPSSTMPPDFADLLESWGEETHIHSNTNAVPQAPQVSSIKATWPCRNGPNLHIYHVCVSYS